MKIYKKTFPRVFTLEEKGGSIPPNLTSLQPDRTLTIDQSIVITVRYKNIMSFSSFPTPKLENHLPCKYL